MPWLKWFAVALLSTINIWLYDGVEGAVCPPDPPHPRAITRLHQNLFCDYDRLARPVLKANNTVYLAVTFQVNTADMAEHQELIMLQGPMSFVWNDANLRWAPSDYEGISYLKLDESEIWLPDLTLNAFTLYGETDLRPRSCVAWFSGTVHCLPQLSMRVPCKQNLRQWPFDEHQCSFTLSSFLYLEEHLNITAVSLDTRMYKSSREWELVSSNSSRYHKNLTEAYGKPTNYPFVQFDFVIRRHAASFFAATVLPSISILFLMLITFWMGEMTVARLCINGFNVTGATLFLDNSLYVIAPNGDEVPVIITLYRDGLALSVFGIIMAVIHKLLVAATSQPPHFITAVTDWLDNNIVGRLLLLNYGSMPIRDDEATIIEAAAAASKTSAWAPLGTLLDRVGFLVSTLAIVILLLRILSLLGHRLRG